MSTNRAEVMAHTPMYVGNSPQECWQKAWSKIQPKGVSLESFIFHYQELRGIEPKQFQRYDRSGKPTGEYFYRLVLQ